MNVSEGATQSAKVSLELSDGLRLQIESEGAAAYPNECCGMLFGRDVKDGSLTRRLVDRLFAGSNTF